jgi:UDP-N-acetyl-D-glucosamine dehydrogenase
MRTLNYRTRFIELASEINAEMPAFVVDKVREALNDRCKPVRGSHVLLLGMAYKRDVDDVRESPALDVLRLLIEDGADVVYHDPYVPTVHENGRSWESAPLDDEALERADVVVILTDHSGFDYEWIVRRSRVLIDTRNATADVAEARAHAHPQRWIVKGGPARETEEEDPRGPAVRTARP